jgi:class 3 adenylate cyclase
MIATTQLPQRFRTIIDEQLAIYNDGRTIDDRDQIPDTTEIPIEDPRQWLKIPDVICVFVDMKGSTRLSATAHGNSTAGAYQLFTATAVKLFHKIEAPYIDVKGDGIFALFNSEQPHRALAAAVNFKTFAFEEFSPRLRNKTKLDIDVHVGIDQKTVLVRKLGLKRAGGRSDRQNEVWAGKPVNMASKLAAVGASGQILISDRYFQNLSDEHALKSCGCDGSGNEVGKTDLWTKYNAADVADPAIFDFEVVYGINNRWCPIHGAEFCQAVIDADR